MLRSIPVCMFHHVSEHRQSFLNVSADNFKSMMRMLHQEGYTTLSSEAFRAIMRGRSAVPPKPVLLTFDDAWLNVFVHAFPVLEHYGHKFTVFVVSDRTDLATRYGRTAVPTPFPTHRQSVVLLNTPEVGKVVCHWDDLRQMLNSGLCSIENHTASHATKDDIRSDIARGRDAIRENLGVPADQLCWPKGKHSGHALAVAKSLGIEITYLVRRGVNIPRLNPMRIKRFTVDDHDGEWLRRQLEIFSRPFYGYLYSRLKPDRWKKRWSKRVKLTI